jgi:hypothetical protein
VLGLYVMSRFAVANSSGMYRSFQEMYLSIRSSQATLAWLPDDFYLALSVGWFTMFFALFAASFFFRKLLARWCENDHAVDALRWLVASGRIRLLFVLLFGLASTTLAFPIAAVPLAMVSLAALALCLYQPFLQNLNIPVDTPSLWRATRGLLSFILLTTVFSALAFALAWLASQAPTPVKQFAHAALYAGETIIGGLIVAIAVFRISRPQLPATLRRFVSSEYFVSLFRLDYFGMLATAWLLPPLMVSAFFMWFAYPTLQYQAQIDGVQLSWWLRAFSGAADAIRHYWFISIAPVVLVLGVLVQTKVVFELERRKLAP